MPLDPTQAGCWPGVDCLPSTGATWKVGGVSPELAGSPDRSTLLSRSRFRQLRPNVRATEAAAQRRAEAGRLGESPTWRADFHTAARARPGYWAIRPG